MIKPQYSERRNGKEEMRVQKVKWNVARRQQERSQEMEQNGMTDKQWKDMLKMLLEILKNEDKEKAIEFIQSLLEK